MKRERPSVVRPITPAKARRDSVRKGTSPMQSGLNVLALVKDSERYVFLYDDASPATVLQQLGRYAADPELSFTWYDAAVLSQKVRRLRQQSSQSETQSGQFREKKV